MSQSGIRGLVFGLIVGLGSAAHGSAGSSSAGEWLIRTWQTEDGLPENSATALVQRRDGYIWFGTFKGLVQFDGIKFRVQTPGNSPGLPHESIVNLHLDAQDRLWASTYGGLALLENGRWRSLGKAGDFVRTFSERKNGDILLTMFDGTVREFSEGILKDLPDPPGEKGKGYFGCADETGRWWVAQHRFVGSWTGREWLAAIPAVNVPSDKAGCGKARDGGMWIFLQRELRKYEKGKEVARVPVPGFKGGFWGLSEDSRGNVWICTADEGLYQVTKTGEVKRWTSGNVLTAAGTRFVFEDREANLWVGTSGGGLMRWNERYIETFGTESGLSEAIVQSLCPAREGGVWVATYGKGLFRLEEGQAKQVPVSGKTAEWRYAQSVLEDRTGRVWLGTFGGGLFRVNRDTVDRFEPNLTGGDNVISLYEDSRGWIWMSGGKGPAVFDGERFQTFAEIENRPKGGVCCFQEDEKNAIWLSNLEGVFRFRNGKFEEIKHGSTAIPRITCLKSSGSDAVWMGSLDSGLLRWHEGELSRVGERAGLPASSVYSLERDERGFLWLTCNQGVIRVEERMLEGFSEGSEGKVPFKLFDRGDGLPTTQFASERQPVAAHAYDGKLWLATIKGAAAIDTRNFHANAAIPRTHIEEIAFYSDSKENGIGKSTRMAPPSTGSVALPAGIRRIEFTYTGLSFGGPQKTKFQVRLASKKERGEWENVGERRSAGYLGLKPGEYTFHVRAESGEGLRDESGTALAFTLAPFFWQRTWFRACAGVSLLAAGWIAARWWNRSNETMKRNNKGMKLAAEVAHLGMWEWDILSDRLSMTATASDLFQFPPGTVLSYEEFFERFAPEDRAMALDAMQLARTNGPYHVTCRLRLPDGSTRWISASGLVDFDWTGRPAHMLAVCMDVSQRRNAEETAWELSGRLIHAQEEERRRIARELHDDLSQRLALLSVEMELLGRTPSGLKKDRENRLERAALQLRELSSEVHKLSHGLHPAKLDQLGLVAAARSFCRELMQQSGIKIQFFHEEVPRDVPPDIALCFYRIMQESLQNIVRHSHANEANVHLQFRNGQLDLKIADSGIGFNVDVARSRSGLGLTSMEERVRLIHGTFKIESKPGSGTQVQVIAPLTVNQEGVRPISAEAQKAKAVSAPWSVGCPE